MSRFEWRQEAKKSTPPAIRVNMAAIWRVAVVFTLKIIHLFDKHDGTG